MTAPWERKLSACFFIAAIIIALSTCDTHAATTQKFATAATVTKGITLCRALRPSRSWYVSSTYMQLVTFACPMPYYIVQCAYAQKNAAGCTVQTIFIDGRATTCTTCCSGSQCTTICS